MSRKRNFWKRLQICLMIILIYFRITGPFVQVLCVNLFAFTVLFSIILGIIVYGVGENIQVVLYLGITFSTIIFTFLGQKIVMFFYKTYVHRNYQKIIPMPFDKQIIKFTIYFLYVIALIVFNSFILNNNYNKPILYAFATYIAFERLISSKPNFKLKSYISKALQELNHKN